MTRTVFYGFDAWVATITGQTTCTWWWQDPSQHGYSGPTVACDLGKDPQAVRAGKITLANIQCDDNQGLGTNGQTRIGPIFPGGTMIGTCWLLSTFYNGLRTKPARLPDGAQCYSYEFENLLDWCGTTSTARYQGTYASIIAQNGNLGQCQVWQPGTSLIPGQGPMGTYWLDFTNDIDPFGGGYTMIGLGPSDPKSGALFIKFGGTVNFPPKNPTFLGGFLPRKIHADR